MIYPPGLNDNIEGAIEEIINKIQDDLVEEHSGE